nr:uncharacterized protein LOC129267001 [Lytechinus pictus]
MTATLNGVDFRPEFNDPSSTEYMEFVSKAEAEIMNGLQNNQIGGYVMSASVTSLSPGSVVMGVAVGVSGEIGMTLSQEATNTTSAFDVQLAVANLVSTSINDAVTTTLSNNAQLGSSNAEVDISQVIVPVTAGGTDLPNEVTPGGTCDDGFFRCSDGLCIHESLRCDYQDHCITGEDELLCGECTSDQFECGNGKCIPEYFVCNYLPECQDFEDETGCGQGEKVNITLVQGTPMLVQNPSYPNPYPALENRYWAITTEDPDLIIGYTFIDIELRLGAVLNFENGTDVSHPVNDLASYNYRFQPEGFFALQTNAAFMFFYPGRYPGGRGFQIELNAIEPSTFTPAPCVDGQFQCASDGECIPSYWQCDYIVDCADETDEDVQVCANLPAPGECVEGNHQYQCDDGSCIHNSWKCDWYEDCPGGEDELYCDCDQSNSFPCGPTDRCIPDFWVCNWFFDCENGADETVCGGPDSTDARFLSPGESFNFTSPNYPNEYGANVYYLYTFETSQSYRIQIDVYQFSTALGGFTTIGDGLDPTNHNFALAYLNHYTKVPTSSTIRVTSTSYTLWLEIHGGPYGFDVLYASATSIPLTCEADEYICPGYCIPGDFECDFWHDCLNGEDEMGCGHEERIEEYTLDLDSSQVFTSPNYSSPYVGDHGLYYWSFDGSAVEGDYIIRFTFHPYNISASSYIAFGSGLDFTNQSSFYAVYGGQDDLDLHHHYSAENQVWVEFYAGGESTSYPGFSATAELILRSDQCAENQFQCPDLTCIPLFYQCDFYPDCVPGYTDELLCPHPPVVHQEIILETSYDFTSPLYPASYPGNSTFFPYTFSSPDPSKHIMFEFSVFQVGLGGALSFGTGHDYFNFPSTFDVFHSNVAPTTVYAQSDQVWVEFFSGFTDGQGFHATVSTYPAGLIPPPVVCDSSQWACHDGLYCIPLSYRCDGHQDCPSNGEDEHGCPNSNCREYQFECKNGACLPEHSQCNGLEQCSEGEDEIGCGHQGECTDQQFRCTNGTCIPGHQRCNYFEDCLDGSDESQAECGPCNNLDSYTCNAGNCIPLYWRCDFYIDCYDGDDEMQCHFLNDPTNITLAMGEQTNITSQNWPDSADPAIYQLWHITAPEGALIHVDFLDYDLGVQSFIVFSDGHMVGDHSNEWAYYGYRFNPEILLSHNNTVSVQYFSGAYVGTRGFFISMRAVHGGHVHPACADTAYQCAVDSECIPRWWLCDGYPDCLEGEDEANCTYSPSGECGVHADEYKCNNTDICFPGAFRCDYMPDCPEHDDEFNCNCTENEFKCLRNGQCLPNHFACDFYYNCGPEDRSDEIEGCGTPNSLITKNLQLEQLYTILSTNYPNPYPPRDYLVYIISVPDDYVVRVIFNDFSIDWKGFLAFGHGDDYHDHDQAFAVYNHHDKNPVNFYTPTNQFYIVFHGGPYGQSTGYNISMIPIEKTATPTVIPPGTCEPGQFACFDGTCYPGIYECDDIVDCDQGEDEARCYATGGTCQSHQFTCNDGSCIHGDWRCDQFFDCAGGDDEQDCPFRCFPGQFQCEVTETCIPQGFTCDYYPDCADGADEKICGTCGAGFFNCSDGACIPDYYVCDAYNDCLTALDEDSCGTIENTEYITLGMGEEQTIQSPGYPDASAHDAHCYLEWIVNVPDGYAIHLVVNDFSIPPAAWLQMGTGDDADNDTSRYAVYYASTNPREIVLPDSTAWISYHCGAVGLARGFSITIRPTDITTHNYTACEAGEFQCNDGHCIPSHYLCDDFKDCSQEEDENHLLGRVNCSSFNHYECGTFATESQYECPSGLCIHSDWRCDGDFDCPSGADETMCGPCQETEFECPHQQCISGNFRCNFFLNCLGGFDDELNCGTPDTTNSARQMVRSQQNFSLRRIWDPGSVVMGVAVGVSGEIGMTLSQEATNTTSAFDVQLAVANLVSTSVNDAVTTTLSNNAQLGSSNAEVEISQGGTCDDGFFRCSDGLCIHESLRCDYQDHCITGEDEQLCGECTSDQFECGNGKCIPEYFVCDYYPECQDFEDETGCGQGEIVNITLVQGTPMLVQNPSYPNPYPALENRYWAITTQDPDLIIGYTFIDIELRLGAVLNFENGTDVSHPVNDLASYNYRFQPEGFFALQTNAAFMFFYPGLYPGGRGFQIELNAIEPSTFTPAPCVDGQFQCASDGECIPSYWQCDYIVDCADETDEDVQVCANHPAPGECVEGNHQYQCDDGSCIHNSWKCDWYEDCPGGEDELYCDCDQSNSFQCVPTDRCIPDFWVCNWFFDCENGADETVCGGPDSTDARFLSPGESFNFTSPNYPNEYGANVYYLFTFETSQSYRIQIDVYQFSTALGGFTTIGDGLDPTNDNSALAYLNHYTQVPTSSTIRVTSTSYTLWLEIHGGPYGFDVLYASATSIPLTCEADEYICPGYCIPGDFECDFWHDCLNGEDEMGCGHEERINEYTLDLDSSQVFTSPNYSSPYVGDHGLYYWSFDGFKALHQGYVGGETHSATAELILRSDQCAENQFQCPDLTCIPLFYQCDFYPDCVPGYTDELLCPHPPVVHQEIILETSYDFTSPLYPANYPGNSTFFPYTFSSPDPSKHIMFEFSVFQVGLGGALSFGTGHDYFNFPSTFDVFHSNVAPTTVYAQSDQVWVEFFSGFTDGQGFRATVSTYPAGLIPPPVVCDSSQWACHDGLYCIPLRYRCDGHQDCPSNGEDEHGCPNSNCREYQFECKNGACLPEHSQCNGLEQCSEGEDEIGCGHQGECTDQQFRCTNGTCIPGHQRCNYFEDCLDGSDESQAECGPCNDLDSYTCNAGNCIPLYWRCDFYIDCYDGDDEMQCHFLNDPTNITLAIGEQTNITSQNWPDSADPAIYQLWHTAPEGALIHVDFLDYDLGVQSFIVFSDGHMVGDHSNEWAYYGYRFNPEILLSHNNTVSVQYFSGAYVGTRGFFISMRAVHGGHVHPACADTAYQCAVDSECIPRWWLCDGYPDCLEGEDEANCTYSPPGECGVHADEYKCNNTDICFPGAFRCDYMPDCPEHDDEFNCNCTGNEFKCLRNGQCLPNHFACDFYYNCGPEDRSDEIEGCGTPNSLITKNLQLEQLYTILSTNYPNPYPPRDYLVYIISAPDDYVVRVIFNDFSIDWKGFLAFGHGSDYHDHDQAFAVYNHHDKNPVNFYTPTNQFYIVFHGGPYGQSTGYNISMIPIEKTATPTVIPPGTCEPGQFACFDGTCYPGIYECDDIVDCDQGEDEARCYATGGTCQSHQFTCNDGSCIHGDWRCDEFFDCAGGEDEQDCPFRCFPGQFLCEVSETCIPQGFTCDYYPDCADGADEKICGTCGAGFFNCSDGACIPDYYVCDAYNDCLTALDEDSCGTIENTVIPPQWSVILANGHVTMDCTVFHYAVDVMVIRTVPPNGRQAAGCRPCNDLDSYTCNAVTTSLSTGGVISTLTVLMAMMKCNAISSMIQMDLRPCQETEFECPHQQCISGNFRCNFFLNCLDGFDDELNCGTPDTTTYIYLRQNSTNITSVNYPYDYESNENYEIIVSVDLGRAIRVIFYDINLSLDTYLAFGHGNDPEDFDNLFESYSHQSTVPAEFNSITNKMFIKFHSGRYGGMAGYFIGLEDVDPTDTTFAPCAEGRFQCPGDGACIPLIWECDGVTDCGFAGDEINCQVPEGELCQEHHFTCNNSQCIRASWECDNFEDCSDGSDEENCPFLGCGDSPFLFECSASQQCIPGFRTCNHVADCDLGEDEAGCGDCQDGFFTCSNGGCVPEYWRCDGDNDCFDGGDERNCGVIGTIENIVLTQGETQQVSSPGFPMRYESLCYVGWQVTVPVDRYVRFEFVGFDLALASYVTVGTGLNHSNHDTIVAEFHHSHEPRQYVVQSNEAWLEFHCGPFGGGDGFQIIISAVDPDTYIHPTCPSNEFQCSDGNCIETFDLCNGVKDCLGGEDEDQDCDNFDHSECGTNDDKFVCHTPLGPYCIYPQYRCNGIRDCFYSEDETDCECQENEFQCVETKRCINAKYYCDNFQDCSLPGIEDRSDETGCANLNNTVSYNLTSPINITSPNYPGDYPKNDYTLTLVTAPEGMFVRARVLDLAVSHSTFIVFLNGHDAEPGNSNFIASLEFGDDETEILSDGNMMAIKFYSGFYAQARGYLIELSYMDEATCTPDEFTCEGGGCIDYSDVCDLFPHCPTFSDENNCQVPAGDQCHPLMF